MFKPKNIMVTGGAGFIGSHLVEMLQKSDSRIVIPFIKSYKNSYLSQIIKPKTKLLKVNINNKSEIHKLVKKFKIDFIFHLAAETQVVDSLRNPYRTLKTNIMGTISLLEIARLENNIPIIIASSDKAYGKSTKPYKESDPLKGDHPYDVSKSATDLIAQAYIKTYDSNVVIVRSSNTYGPGDLNFDRIIPGICRSIIKNEKLSLRSNGKYRRDFIYVKDAAMAYKLTMDKFPNVNKKIYNISSNENYSTIELIKAIEKIQNIKISYKILNGSVNEIPFQKLNDSKIKKLGWKNKHTLKSSFNKTLDWYIHYFKKA